MSDDPVPSPVVVTDVRIPFVSLVWLMVKISIATIPAAFILLVTGVVLLGVLRSLGVVFHL